MPLLLNMLLGIMLLLAIMVWLAARLVLAAHRRATDSIVREIAFTDLEIAFTDLDRQDEVIQAANQRSALISKQEALAETLRDPNTAPSLIASRDAYADPIDGVPFLPGEHAIPCACGVAYRAESLDWLSVHCIGQCVHCGSPIEAAQRSLA